MFLFTIHILPQYNSESLHHLINNSEELYPETESQYTISNNWLSMVCFGCNEIGCLTLWAVQPQLWCTDTKWQGSVNDYIVCVWQPWKMHTRESMITVCSYGMWLVDCLRYVIQWIGIVISHAHICVYDVCMLCVNTYDKVDSVVIGLDLVCCKFDSVKVHLPLSIIMNSQKVCKPKVVF